MQDLEQFKAAFFQECDELIAEFEAHATRLSDVSEQPLSLNAAFRAVHSLKGGAGMFGFNRLVSFAHTLENVLDGARSGRIETNAAVIDAILRATDILAGLSEAARTGKPLPDDYEADSGAQLSRFVDGAHLSKPEPGQAADVAPTTHVIRFEPAPDIFRRGLEPQLLVRNLGELGQLDVAADASRLPSFLQIDPVVAYVSWVFTLRTLAPLEAVRDVFRFVSDDCRLQISAIEAVDSSAPQAASEVPAKPAFKADERMASIRVDLDRVDRLVDLVGEISIAQSMLAQHLEQSVLDANPHLSRALSQVLQLSRGLQDGVMAIRAQPIRSILTRMPRVVREAAHNTGKKVRLEILGEDTEIDKTIVEQLYDPLIHTVRNAVDHGIEPAAERRAAGKPETGAIAISAAQRGGRIIIEVRDDGRGIDRMAVRRRAADLHLIDEGASLSDNEIENLVFRPGLSTARSVSNLSGRGVGMDVIHRNIHKLGGRASIRSEPGVGTTTTIVLPLTLAVLDAMLVRSASERYLIPLASILECIAVSVDDLNDVPGAGKFVSVRGRQVRVVDLAQRLQKRKTHSDRLHIVLVEIQNHRLAGLIVDEICGHRQVVVKSVRQHFAHIPGVAGATILGDGRVAFILDAEEVAAQEERAGVPVHGAQKQEECAA